MLTVTLRGLSDIYLNYIIDSDTLTRPGTRFTRLKLKAGMPPIHYCNIAMWLWCQAHMLTIPFGCSVSAGRLCENRTIMPSDYQKHSGPLRPVPSISKQALEQASTGSKPAPEKDFFRSTPQTWRGVQASHLFMTLVLFSFVCGRPDLFFFQLYVIFAFHGSGSSDPRKAGAAVIVSCTTAFVGRVTFETKTPFTAMGCCQIRESSVDYPDIVFNLQPYSIILV
jgi:hypothetical protein